MIRRDRLRIPITLDDLPASAIAGFDLVLDALAEHVAEADKARTVLAQVVDDFALTLAVSDRSPFVTLRALLLERFEQRLPNRAMN